MTKHRKTKKKKPEAKKKKSMFPRRFLTLYRCNECGHCWAWYKSVYAACATCSSQDYSVVPGSFDNPWMEIVPDEEKV